MSLTQERGIGGETFNQLESPLPRPKLDLVHSRPSPFRIDVIGRQRRNAAPVIDAGVEIGFELFTQIRWRLQRD